MVSAISEGIRVEVEVFFQKDYSNPVAHDYMFAYRITIINENNFAVQLLKRKWEIFDSNGTYKTVEGEGVIGVQPIIEPQKHYTYVSGCNIKSDMGKMYGTYTMKNFMNNTEMTVRIPVFALVYPYKYN